MRWLALVVLCSCGRIGFDPAEDLAPGGAGDDTPGAVLGCAGARPPILDRSDARLAGYWSFNTGSAVVADQSPSHLAATPRGEPIAIGDGVDGARRFTGDDAYAVAGGGFDVGLADFTVEAMVRISDCAAPRPIVGRSSATAAWRLACEAGAAVFRLADRDGHTAELRSPAPIADAAWHHVIGIRRGAAIELWLDGERAAADPSPGLGRVDSNEALVIGSTTTAQFIGDLDEVRIWRAALAPDEIARLRAWFRPGLAGYWSFDDDASAFAGTPHAGTVIGAAAVGDPRARAGGAASFGGNTGRIDISLPDVFSASYTATAWFRTTTPGVQSLLNHEDELDPSSPVQLWLADDEVGTRSAGLGGATTASLADGCWHHVAVVRDGADHAAGAVRLYVDGALAVEQTGSFGATALPAPALRVGYRLIRDPRPFTGEIDELSVYRRALSAAELAEIHAALE